MSKYMYFFNDGAVQFKNEVTFPSKTCAIYKLNDDGYYVFFCSITLSEAK